MPHLTRRLLLLVPLTLTPVFATLRWQESGWIGTCAGIGCTGLMALCATHSYTTSSGSRVTNYCYLDP